MAVPPAGQAGAAATPVAGRFSAASGAMLREAALAGMGLAVLPTFMVYEHLIAGRLRSVLPDHFAGVDLTIHAVYAQTRQVPIKVRALIDVLVSHFQTPPWYVRPRPG